MRAERIDGARDSLRVQLLWWLVPPVLLVVLVSSFVTYTIALGYANHAYDQRLFDEAKSLAEQVRFGTDGRPILELPLAAEEMLRSDPVDRIFYRVLSATGETVAGRGDLPAPREAVGPGRPVYYDAMVGDAPVRICAYRLSDDATSGAAVILVGETLIKRDTLSKSLLVSDFLIPMVTLPMVMAVILWFGIRRGLDPLRRLAATLAKRGWNDLGTIDDEGVPREVRPLIHAINDLMQRLAAALSAQQRFISEAAHQLRTPLAGVTAQTERALLARDVEAMKAALIQLQVASRRAGRLVNQLLTLARAEPGSDWARDFRPLDLAGLARKTCMEWVPEALDKGVDLGFAGETAPVVVEGDELLLTEMLNNLIDNALRHGARAGGSVTVRLTRSPRVELSVEDDGPGIAEEERSRVFERFQRGSGSSPGGAGLGLAIVREIARSHGAAVCVESNRPHGAVFRVVFADCASAAASPRGQ
ncbi:MAG TPA: sensor histidine kinase N-terminal domain-containing protein [Burkholderiales bacterium]|nr:sensor histidine kinase N-terminal domain-containing protein [Burkholderiales bacterium]